MLNGAFVFDNSIHLHDMSDANLRSSRDDARPARDHLASLGAAMGWPTASMTPEELARRWSVEEVHHLVFDDGLTDMAMTQVVPIFEWYEDFLSPVELQHAMAERYPDRVMFCGGVDPLYPDLAGALRQLEHQIGELGARSIKFYNGHVGGGWRCDDRELAYPLYQRCLELGVEVVQFHKGFPFGLMNVEQLQPNDLQAPARDFPELTFIIHHLSLPYFEETVSIASRFPNVALSLASNLSGLLIEPRQVQKQMGRLLRDVGAEKLLWASDAPLLGPPRPYLEAFMAMTIPEDLRDGYGYPQITPEDRALILGGNFARIMGVDVDAKLRELEAVA
jgi:predicted TIM-barrel fold metal-dependent hydrolase